MYKVIVIEDDPILNRAYTTVLSAEGFQVESATDGHDGIQKAQSGKPDVVLLDMLMPSMDGISFLRTFKQKELHPNTKIIVFSNMSVPESMHEAMSLGAVKYLTKSSFTPREMVEVIKSVLGTQSAPADDTKSVASPDLPPAEEAQTDSGSSQPTTSEQTEAPDSAPPPGSPQ